MHAVLKLIYKYITKNKARCVLIGFCIMMSSALIFFLQLEMQDFNDSRKEKRIDNEGGIFTCSVLTNSIEYIDKLKTIDIVKNMSYEVHTSRYFSINNSIEKIYLAGFEDNIDELLNFKLHEGSYPKNNNEIALEKWIIEKIEPSVHIGDKIKVSYKDFERELTLVGTYDYIKYKNNDKNLGFGYITLDTAKEIRAKILNETEMKNEFTFECMLELTTTSVETIEDKLLFGDARLIYNGRYSSEVLKKIYNRERNMNFVMSSIVILLTVLMLYNVMSSSVNIKSAEFGMMKTIGMTNTQIRYLILGESFILGFVFTGISVMLGNIGYKLILNILDLGNISYNIRTISIRAIMYTYLFCLPAIVLSSYFSSRKLTYESAIEQIRGHNRLDIDV